MGMTLCATWINQKIRGVSFTLFTLLKILIFLIFTIHHSLLSNAFAGELNLQNLIDEALKNNPEILVAEYRFNASKFRVPQIQSLPDPMFMIGYQNEGTRSLYSFGSEMTPDSQWMFSLSQMIPFPGKLSLKGEMSLLESEGQKWSIDNVRSKIVLKIKELYYDLCYFYTAIDILKEKEALFSKIEDAARSRYTTLMASQQDILMAQTEKYMILEKTEMFKQRIQSIEAMINATLGKDINSPLGRPANIPDIEIPLDIDKLIIMVKDKSPEIKLREKMVASLEKRLEMARLEYYPDFTFTASYFLRSKFFPDMWSLTASINLPIFYKTKQRELVNETKALLEEAKYELESIKLMIFSTIKDSYSIIITAEKLMDLYKNALIPRTYQDFNSAISAYISGKTDLGVVLSRLKSLLDYEVLYWNQFIEKQKAIAKIEALLGTNSR